MLSVKQDTEVKELEEEISGKSEVLASEEKVRQKRSLDQQREVRDDSAEAGCGESPCLQMKGLLLTAQVQRSLPGIEQLCGFYLAVAGEAYGVEGADKRITMDSRLSDEGKCDQQSVDSDEIKCIFQGQIRKIQGFPGGAVVESLPANAGHTGSNPGLGGSHMPRSSWAGEPRLLSLRVWSLCSATREAAIVRGPRTAMKSGPHLPQLEKALAQKRRPGTAINKINK